MASAPAEVETCRQLLVEEALESEGDDKVDDELSHNGTKAVGPFKTSETLNDVPTSKFRSIVVPGHCLQTVYKEDWKSKGAPARYVCTKLSVQVFSV